MYIFLIYILCVFCHGKCVTRPPISTQYQQERQATSLLKHCCLLASLTYTARRLNTGFALQTSEIYKLFCEYSVYNVISIVQPKQHTGNSSQASYGQPGSSSRLRSSDTLIHIVFL